jgi:hypothetical protein
MNVTGTWRIVSSPDFDDDYLRMRLIRTWSWHRAATA